MAEKIDRLTIYVENGRIAKVVPEDPSMDAGELTSADYEAIVRNDYQVMASITSCRLYPDGNCYYVIAQRKYRCTCP
jgi:hypothetical protein